MPDFRWSRVRYRNQEMNSDTGAFRLVLFEESAVPAFYKQYVFPTAYILLVCCLCSPLSNVPLYSLGPSSSRISVVTVNFLLFPQADPRERDPPTKESLGSSVPMLPRAEFVLPSPAPPWPLGCENWLPVPLNSPH